MWESGGKRQEAFSSPEKVHPQLAHNLRPSGDLVANPGRRWLSFVVPGTGPRDVRCEGQGFSDKVERSLSEVRVVKPKLSVRSAVNLSNPVHLPVVFITKTQTGKVAGWIGRRCRVCREWLASRASPRFDSLGDRADPVSVGRPRPFRWASLRRSGERGQPSIVGSNWVGFDRPGPQLAALSLGINNVPGIQRRPRCRFLLTACVTRRWFSRSFSRTARPFVNCVSDVSTVS